MREIKFRAWSKDGGMLPAVVPLPDNHIIEIQPMTHHARAIKVEAIMQYTGLHDKNGKEIYEGDIVSCQDHFNNRFVKPVVYEKDAFIVKGDGTSLAGYTADIQWEQRLCGLGEIEIIGNIYENPMEGNA